MCIEPKGKTFTFLPFCSNQALSLLAFALASMLVTGWVCHGESQSAALSQAAVHGKWNRPSLLPSLCMANTRQVKMGHLWEGQSVPLLSSEKRNSKSKSQTRLDHLLLAPGMFIFQPWWLECISNWAAAIKVKNGETSTSTVRKESHRGF